MLTKVFIKQILSPLPPHPLEQIKQAKVQLLQQIIMVLKIVAVAVVVIVITTTTITLTSTNSSRRKSINTTNTGGISPTSRSRNYERQIREEPHVIQYSS